MSEKKSEMVAVMLPRSTAESLLLSDPCSYDWAMKEAQLATKRALRPQLPDQIVPKLYDHGSMEFAITADWILWVLENGWEAE